LYFWIILRNFKRRIVKSCPCTAGYILAAAWSSRDLPEGKYYEKRGKEIVKSKRLKK
jgi:hypothetical protein